MPRPSFIVGDCVEALKAFPENYFHACVTDPPAGIAFMGSKWDSNKGGRREWIAWLTGAMREVHRVLRPGAHAVVWALPRTSHWTATALEDAGFQIRDCCYHVFGQGFPKSANAGKLIDRAAGADREVIGSRVADDIRGGNLMHRAIGENENKHIIDITASATPEAREWEGYGTALKPSVEVWWLVRKPLDGTIAENLLRWGCGALNIDACRVRGPVGKPWGQVHPERPPTPGWEVDGKLAPAPEPNPKGRWPSQFLMTHDSRCEIRGTKKVRGITGGTGNHEGNIYGKRSNVGAKVNDYASENGEEEVEDWRCVGSCPIFILDSQSGTTSAGGQPARRGVEGVRNAYGHYGPQDSTTQGQGPSEGYASRFYYCAKAGSERESFNKHPTLKSLNLVSYFLKLVAPPGGRVIDPFCGSGTVNLASMRLNLESVGIDLSEEYVSWARRRCAGALDAFDADAPSTFTHGEKA